MLCKQFHSKCWLWLTACGLRGVRRPFPRPLHYWGSLEYGLFSVLARWLLNFAFWSRIVKLMDDEMACGASGRSTWVPLQFLVTFTRVSSGREEPRGEWRGGIRNVLCRGMPWVIRCSVLSASWPSLRVTDVFAQLIPTESNLWQSPSYAPSYAPSHAPSHQPSYAPSYAPSYEPQGCASFTGFAVPREELRRVREFNGCHAHTARCGIPCDPQGDE